MKQNQCDSLPVGKQKNSVIFFYFLWPVTNIKLSKLSSSSPGCSKFQDTYKWENAATLTQNNHIILCIPVVAHTKKKLWKKTVSLPVSKVLNC